MNAYGVTDKGGKDLVSVIMPAYNAEPFIQEAIKSVYSRLREAGINHEIIVVSDGSKDDTESKARQLIGEITGVRVFGYAENRGKGFALLYGFRRSVGDPIIFFDSDLDIPPEQILLLLKALRKAGADAAITNKWHPRSRTQATMLRMVLSKSYNALVRLLTGLQLSDTQTGSKAFRRYVLDEITPKMYIKRYAFDTELLLLTVRHGYRIVEVPSIREIRLNSPFEPKEIIEMLLELLSITYRHGRV